jgi:hypothetical protein
VKAFAIIGVLALAGCVAGTPEPDGGGAGVVPVFEPITVDGKAFEFAMVPDWPSMASVVVADTGESEIVQMGRDETVIIQGTGNDFTLAVKALAQVCGREIDPMGFDTQFVFYQDTTDQFWFDGFCG